MPLYMYRFMYVSLPNVCVCNFLFSLSGAVTANIPIAQKDSESDDEDTENPYDKVPGGDGMDGEEESPYTRVDGEDEQVYDSVPVDSDDDDDEYEYAL